MSAEAPTPDVMRLGLLGAPVAYWCGTPLALPTRRSLPLLCLLALSDRPMPRAELGRLLWEVPRAVNLRQELAKLRKLPGASQWLRERCNCVELVAQTAAAEFVAAARRDDHAAAMRIWRRNRASSKRRDHLLFGTARPHWALLPDGGGDPLTPHDVYVHGRVTTLPAWQSWAQAAKAKLDAMIDNANAPQPTTTPLAAWARKEPHKPPETVPTKL